MSRMLCRVSVDDDFYNEYKEKKFKVPHDFKAEQPERTLETIDFFARSSEYKKYYPEFHAACKEIVDRERKNIEAYYAKKSGRKEYIAMKHDDFTGYMKDLQEIQRAAAKERRELKAEFDRAAKKWEEAQRDKTLSDFGRTGVKWDYLQAEKAYKEAIADLKQRTDASVKGVREEFHKHIDDFYSANGDRIDGGTVQLLQSGIKLSDGEINRLVESNLSNPTMLRIISDHCDRNKIDNKVARIYGGYARGAGKNEKSAFEQIVSMIDRVTGTDETIAEVWGKENSHFEKLSNETIEGVASLAIHPETSGE